MGLLDGRVLRIGIRANCGPTGALGAVEVVDTEMVRVLVGAGLGVGAVGDIVRSERSKLTLSYRSLMVCGVGCTNRLAGVIGGEGIIDRVPRIEALRAGSRTGGIHRSVAVLSPHWARFHSGNYGGTISTARRI